MWPSLSIFVINLILVRANLDVICNDNPSKEVISTTDKNVVYDIDHCNNVEIRLSAFSNVSSFTYVKALKNQISILDDYSFAGAYQVKIMDLRTNLIEEISQNAFKGLSSLRYLYMKDNRLKYLKPGVFDNLIMLEEIWLQNNLLEILERNLFSNNTNLKNVFLVENKITAIEPSIFEGLPFIKDVSLRKNLCTDKNYEFYVVDTEIVVVQEITGYSKKNLTYEKFQEEKCFENYQENARICDLMEVQNPRCDCSQYAIEESATKCSVEPTASLEKIRTEAPSSSLAPSPEKDQSHHEDETESEEFPFFWILFAILVCSALLNLVFCFLFLYSKCSVKRQIVDEKK